MKYSFLMPYIDRLEQFKKTLESFERYNRTDFEIILAVDVKNTDNILSLESKFPTTKVVTGSRDRYNPAPLFNVAADNAKGEIYIITNPECRHESDILAGLDEEFAKNRNAYVVCGCESERDGKHHMWYQHSKYRNACYHFCTAISAENFHRIGFDERFSKGIGYDDDDFRDAVRIAGLPFVLRDDLLTVHQWHSKDRPRDYRARLARNKALYESKWHG